MFDHPEILNKNVIRIGKSFFLNTSSPDLTFPAFRSQGNTMPVIKWEYFMVDWKSNYSPIPLGNIKHNLHSTEGQQFSCCHDRIIIFWLCSPSDSNSAWKLSMKHVSSLWLSLVIYYKLLIILIDSWILLQTTLWWRTSHLRLFFD